jgi:signal transduction histidine kinase
MRIASMAEYGVAREAMAQRMPSDPRDDGETSPAAPLDAAAALAGAIAHDLGNMLTVVLGNAELLVEALADRPELMDLASLILGAAQRGTELTSRLDRFARPQRSDAAAADPGPVLAEFGRRVAYSLPPEIGFEMSAAPGLCRADVPAAALVAALDELVANALAALDGRGTLRIAARNAVGTGGQRRLLISVEDDAGGMQPETLRRVRGVGFTAGIAGHKTAIGLALALRVAHTGQGRLLVASMPGQGTRVTLDFPART